MQPARLRRSRRATRHALIAAGQAGNLELVKVTFAGAADGVSVAQAAR
jgi:hypothetical protein